MSYRRRKQSRQNTNSKQAIKNIDKVDNLGTEIADKSQKMRTRYKHSKQVIEIKDKR